MTWALAMDPGAHTGIALVEAFDEVRGTLVAVEHVTGSSHLRWYLNARTALGRLGLHVTTPTELRLVLEEPPVRSRRGALHGDAGGQRTWCGIGRYQGMLMAACVEWCGRMPVLVPAGEWTDGLHPLVRKSKDGDGWHRVGEAERWLVGSKPLLAGIPKTSRIDCAEAGLLGLAAVLGRLPTLEGQPVGGLSAS